MSQEFIEIEPRKKYKYPCTPRRKRSAEKIPSSATLETKPEEDGESYLGEDRETVGEDRNVDLITAEPEEHHRMPAIKVGDNLPYGQRLFEGDPENLVRMKDIGVSNRILVIGVLGSFTPDCWNRHLYQVLKKYDYYKERGVNHICCVSTNDTYAQTAWGKFLGCSEKILMWSDTTTRFTRLIGLETIVPWLDNTFRSRRYVLLADDMVVTKIIVAPDDSLSIKWKCQHIVKSYENAEESSEDPIIRINSKPEMKSTINV